MELFLSKLAQALLSPLSSGLLLILLGWLLFLLKKKRLATTSSLLGIAWLWICSAPVIADRLSGSLERTHPPVPIEDTPKADAIVVLGGGVGGAEPPRLTLDLDSASDRVLHAARLYRAGKAPRVIASGGAIALFGSTIPEAEAMGELLREWGVPESAILLETRSKTTYENAVETKKILEETQMDSVLLVTSATHMRRALATFQAGGINAIPAPTDFETIDRRERTLIDWLPNAEALERTTRVLKEYLGFTVYRYRGWL